MRFEEENKKQSIHYFDCFKHMFHYADPAVIPHITDA